MMCTPALGVSRAEVISLSRTSEVLIRVSFRLFARQLACVLITFVLDTFGVEFSTHIFPHGKEQSTKTVPPEQDRRTASTHR